MTFTQLVADVMDRLNLTSTSAQTRIGQRINERYKKVTSSVNLITSRHLSTPVTIDPGVEVDLPNYTVDDMEKVTRIVLLNEDGGILRVLDQVTYDDATHRTPYVRTPREWAVKNMGPGYVVITFDAFPETDPFDLLIDGYDVTDTLAGSQEPVFPTDFHDILIEGAMSDELRKMEKADLASICETNYASRLNDLRMFIAKSAYLDIQQGRHNNYPYKGSQSWWKSGWNND